MIGPLEVVDSPLSGLFSGRLSLEMMAEDMAEEICSMVGFGSSFSSTGAGM